MVDKPVATTALQQYIDASVKPDYIENFMNDNLSDLKSKIDASHNSIITTITDFSMDGASSYLVILPYQLLVRKSLFDFTRSCRNY